MAFSPDDVARLALLARLELHEEEKARLATELGRIVGYVDELAAVDVTGVEPMTHAVPTTLTLRPDVAQEEVAGRRALAGSAGYDDGLVRVPKIVE